MSLMLVNTAMHDLVKQVPLDHRENRTVLRNTILHLQAELDKIYSIAQIELEYAIGSTDRKEILGRLQRLPTTMEESLRQFHIRMNLLGIIRKLEDPISHSQQEISELCDLAIENIVKGVFIIGDKLLRMANDISIHASKVDHSGNAHDSNSYEIFMDKLDTEIKKINASKDFIANMARQLLHLL